jgi:hypothetical protein
MESSISACKINLCQGFCRKNAHQVIIAQDIEVSGQVFKQALCCSRRVSSKRGIVTDFVVISPCSSSVALREIAPVVLRVKLPCVTVFGTKTRATSEHGDILSTAG